MIAKCTACTVVTASCCQHFRPRTLHAQKTLRTCCLRVRCETGNGTSFGVPWLVEPSRSPAQDYEAVLVLAGGLTTHEKHLLPQWVTRRLDAAAGLQQKQNKTCPIVCLGGGTPHKPAILSGTGHVVHESSACAEYLIDEQGVQPSTIYKEVSSYDTVGNGYFALMIHAVPAGWRKLAIITSAFHMPRSRAIFEVCFGLAGQALYRDASWCQLDFLAVTDEGVFEEDVLAARQRREASSLQAWKQTSKSVGSLPELQAWLHTQHLCYAVARQEDFGKPNKDDVDSNALASY